jgi:Tfp pilus assembly protein PilX
MKPFSHSPRGMVLVIAMIVVVLITLLVAGAISFTGTERAAAEVQTQADTMSTCAVAARNLFVSRMRPLAPASVEFVRIDDEIIDNKDAGTGMRISTAHFTGSAANAVTDAGTPGTEILAVENINKTRAGALSDRTQIMGIDNAPGRTAYSETYRITALCSELVDAGESGAQREIEFLVKVGL